MLLQSFFNFQMGNRNNGLSGSPVEFLAGLFPASLPQIRLQQIHRSASQRWEGGCGHHSTNHDYGIREEQGGHQKCQGERKG